jgi:hypothetical protein
MNFCRQCGAPVALAPDASEQPTSILNQPAGAGTVTDRFESRPTGAPASAHLPYGSAPVPLFPGSGVPMVAKRSGAARGLAIVAVIILVLLGLGSVVGVMRSAIMSRIQRRASVGQPINKALAYPGADTVLNLDSGGGGVLQLKTTDSIDNVAAWYETNLKPTKTIKLGPTVIMKADNVAVYCRGR